MSNGYQPSLIADIQSGINTYLDPWKRPTDAFEPLMNAYVNRGSINKRNGYVQFGDTLADIKPVMGLMRYIDQSDGSNKLLAATTQHLYLYDGFSSYSDISVAANDFTGGISNFFNYTNWQPTTGAASAIYMTNDVDPVTVWIKGAAAAAQPDIWTNSAKTTKITKCLDVQVYKQRLLFIRPALTGSAQTENQTIYWTKINSGYDPAPGSFINAFSDVAGNGGFLTAPTGDIIQCAQFIRDVLVVFFTHSTWLFKFTGSQSQPFVWCKVNDTRSVTAPYASVSYDDYCTAVGNTGLIACSGTNVERYDLSIIDYFDTEVSSKYVAQSFAHRYDTLSQTWMLYVSNNRNQGNFPLVGLAPGSDKALIYNYQEKSFSTYQFSRPMTCLGLFYNSTGATWASLTEEWKDVDRSWGSYADQTNFPILLAGDTTGHIWYMDAPNTVDDAGEPIKVDIATTRWNPLLGTGQKAQFGYIDIYYYVSSLDVADPVTVTLNFYADNSDNLAFSRPLTLDGPTGTTNTFKRIYLNIIGGFIQMEIVASESSAMKFLGFILWARPAGRLTP